MCVPKQRKALCEGGRLIGGFAGNGVVLKQGDPRGDSSNESSRAANRALKSLLVKVSGDRGLGPYPVFSSSPSGGVSGVKDGRVAFASSVPALTVWWCKYLAL